MFVERYVRANLSRFPKEILLPKVAMAISLLSQTKIDKHSLCDKACKHIHIELKKMCPKTCIYEGDSQNLGMTNMKISIRFWWETGHHFSSSCLKMFFQNFLCVMCSPYVPITEKYFCMDLDHKKTSESLNKTYYDGENKQINELINVPECHNYDLYVREQWSIP
jgi:hypothetical protein